MLGQNKSILSAKRTIHIKDARTEKQENPNVPIVRDHVLHLTKCVRNTKEQAFRQHVVNNQKTYASTVSHNTLPQPKTINETFTFTVEQLPKWSYKSPKRKFAAQNKTH